MSESMSIEQYKALGKSHQSKCRNHPVIIESIRFMSKKEGAKHQELKIRERAGEVRNIRRQVPFILQDKFVYNGTVISSIKFIADFVIDEFVSGVWYKDVVLDVKASPEYQTDVYRLKKRMLLYKYPSIIFREEF